MAALYRFFQQWLHPWVSLRKPEREPVALDRRRIYILPTRKGLLFAVMLLVMLLASMNYSNSMGFALTFILTGISLTAMQQCHRNLLGVMVASGGAEPAFAGGTARFAVRLANPGSIGRYAIKTSAAGQGATANLPAGGSQKVTLELPAPRRGELALGQVTVHTTFPLSLFQAWTVTFLDAKAIVYPRPAESAIASSWTCADAGSGAPPAPGQDDFQGLRPYRHGDSPRHIDWKAFARAHTPLVKEFTGARADVRWLDWDSLAGIASESRLSMLCRGVLDAEAESAHYGLRLPGLSIAPGNGARHRQRCLEALALFDAPSQRAPAA
jgi:uncharacterized protein (DUF58 family)